MGITQTTETYYDASTVLDIYTLLFAGDEFAPFQREEAGVDKPRVLPKGAATKDVFQTNIKNPRLSDASGTILIDSRLLEVDRIMSLLTLTPEDWRSEFPEFQPTGTTIDLKMNPTVMATIMELLKNVVNTEISDLVYQGDTAGAGQLVFTDGYSKLFQADAEVIDVANLGVVTKTNIFSIILGIEKAMPLMLRKQKNKVKIFMSYGTYDFIQDANRDTQQNATYLTTPEGTKSPSGYMLEPMESMTDNELFATIANTSKKSNLVRGVWFKNDAGNFVLYKEQPADEDWLIALKFSLGNQYRSGKHVVYYKGV